MIMESWGFLWLGFHQYSLSFQPEVKKKTSHTVENNYISIYVNTNGMWRIRECSLRLDYLGLSVNGNSSILKFSHTHKLSEILSHSQNE